MEKEQLEHLRHSCAHLLAAAVHGFELLANLLGALLDVDADWIVLGQRVPRLGHEDSALADALAALVLLLGDLWWVARLLLLVLLLGDLLLGTGDVGCCRRLAEVGLLQRGQQRRAELRGERRFIGLLVGGLGARLLGASGLDGLFGGGHSGRGSGVDGDGDGFGGFGWLRGLRVDVFVVHGCEANFRLCLLASKLKTILQRLVKKRARIKLTTISPER